MVVILLGNGFEDIEALAPCDILRRGGLKVVLAGVNGGVITSGRGVAVKADCTVHDVDINTVAQLVIPGGMGGVDSISASPEAMGLIKTAAEKGVPTAAICAGPTILAGLGLLKGKKAVCHPDCREGFECGEYIDAPVVKDGSTVTARAAGASLDFGFAILESLTDNQTADTVAKGMCHAR